MPEKKEGFWRKTSLNFSASVLVWTVFLATPFAGYSQTRDAIVRAKIEKILKENMHDPSSYEFVSLIPGVTITYKDNVYSKREDIKGRIESNKFALQTHLDNLSPLVADIYLDDILEWKTEIERDYLLIQKIDSTENALGKKITTPVAYNYKFRCRGKNAFGAKVLNEYFVQVKAPTLEIMNIASETDKIIIDFGDFPGYEEIMQNEENLKIMVSEKAQLFVDSVMQTLNASSKTNEYTQSTSSVLYGKRGGGGGVSMIGFGTFGYPDINTPELPKESNGIYEFRVQVDKEGYVIRVETVQRGLSIEAERRLKAVIQNLQFVPKGNQQAAEGRVIFRVTSTSEYEVDLSSAGATTSGEDPNKIYTVVEQQPEFEGGYEAMMNFIKKTMQYPASARRMGVDGTVYVSFLVGKDGSIGEVKAIRGINPDCDKEAMRVVSLMPPWKPGRENGNPVNVRFVLPIKFNLNR